LNYPAPTPLSVDLQCSLLIIGFRKEEERRKDMFMPWAKYLQDLDPNHTIYYS
jgi:hypothetical protein